MPTTFNIGIDWNRDGLICWDAKPNDPLNLLPRPLTWTRLDLGSDGAPTIQNQPMTPTSFGIRKFNVVTGTNAFGGLRLGQSGFFSSGTINDIPITPGTYRAAIWARGISGFSGVNFFFQALDQTFTNLGSTSNFTLTSDWVRREFTFTAQSGDTHIAFNFLKNNNVANVTFEVSGIMFVPGTVAPGFNAGNPSDLYENTTDRVMSADWFLGSHKAYQEDADDSMLKLKLNNSDKRFSPEYSGSDLNGNLAPYRPVQVRSNDGTTTRTHYTGWLESVQPSVNVNGERVCEITAAGPMLPFEGVETSIEIQENKRTDEIIAKLLKTVIMPPPLSQTWILGAADYGELGQTTFVAGAIIENTLELGKTTLAYAADNWVTRGGSADKDKDTFNVYRAIRDVVAAERGRFYFDRNGEAIFWNRHHLLLYQAAQVTFDDTMNDLSYEYAGLGEFKNEVLVTCHPREVSAGSSELLWKLDKPITLSTDKSRELTASYRDDSDNRIGGKEVTLENVTFSKGTAGIAMEAQANRAKLTITNNSKSQEAVLETAELRGKKITDFGRMEAVERDNLSIALYGKRTLNLGLPSIDNLDFAQSIAGFERNRRSQPAGRVKSITLRSHGKNGGDHHAQQLARTIGDLIEVKETQTAHDQTYFIIGEGHRLTQAGAVFETIWYLEEASTDKWFTVGQSYPDGTAALAY